MLAYNIKEILELIPEALPMVKKASLEEEFPTGNKDSVCASYLRVQYLTKVAGKPVDVETMDKVAQAADLYGVKSELEKLASVFKASPLQEDPMEKVASEFEASLDTMLSVEKTASLATQLFKEGCSEEVLRYSGRTWISKEAAVKALANRFYASKDENFVKLAKAVHGSLRENDFDSIQKLCQTVTGLDKKAGLDLVGFNFYKETLITKEAALRQGCTVTLAGESFPYEKIERFGKDRISSVVGKDVAAGFSGDIISNKYMLESLPRDLQLILKSSLKGV